MIGWIIAGIILFVAVVCLIRGIYETHTLEVNTATLGHGDNALKVVLFSDLHARNFYVNPERLYSAINSSEADLILFAGDMTNGENPKAKSEAATILKMIMQIATTMNIPFYCVNGNHDEYQLDLELIAEGIPFLSNQSVFIHGSDHSSWILAGLEDLRIGQPDYPLAISSLLISDASSLPVIVLAHNPDTIFSLPSPSHPGKLFFLSGHFHGGQIWMPFSFEYKALRKEKMADLGFRKGAFNYREIFGYISRGLGCVIVPFRFFSYPELTILTLRTDEVKSNAP